jgi:hypothetical protein
MFEKETCMLFQGEMVFPRGVRIGTLYKLLENTISEKCKSSIIPEIGADEGKIFVVLLCQASTPYIFLVSLLVESIPTKKMGPPFRLLSLS